MPHYFSEKQNSKIKLKKITIKLKTISFELFTGSGVFSKDSLDKGSQLLIESSQIKDSSTVLDLGCGYGVIGIAVKLLNPSLSITMLDINERAVSLARKNVKLHLLDNKVIHSDLFKKVKNRFDMILVNPPQTAGKDICFSIIENSYLHLNPGGFLHLVARHRKGGLQLQKKMEEIFGNVKVISKKSGYWVYSSEFIS